MEAVLGPRVPGLRCPGIPGTSRDVPDLEAVLSPRVPDPNVLDYPRTSRDVPDLEVVLSPRVTGPRCPGIYQDIPGCPRPGGSVRP